MNPSQGSKRLTDHNMHMPLKLDSLVELQDRYSNVYPLSPSGARGWVRARREMPKNDPEVFIEWDKSHWRYHGEKDGWTFEHHFRPVEDEVASIENAPNIMEQILAEAKRKIEEDRCPNCGGFHDQQDEFLTTLHEAQDAALGSDGYFIITLTPRTQGEYTVYEPQIHTQVLNETAQQLIEAQLVHIAVQLFEQRMLKHINNLDDGRK